MTLLLLGLLLLLGVHSLHLVANDWRVRQCTRWGARRWRALFAAVSLLGLVLVIRGFGLARQTPVPLWFPPMGMRHLASLLTLPAFVLLAAAYVPGNQIKAVVKHPMLLGVLLWAGAHLLANGNLAHVLLFGSFLLWSATDLAVAWRRDGIGSATRKVRKGATGITMAIGVSAWMAFTLWLHGLLIGVRPMG